MAHIVEFTIAGLVGRKDIYKKKLNRGINVFFGLNGSGKTSLLKILHSAMSGDASKLRMVPFEWAKIVIHSIDYHKDFAITIRRPDVESRPLIKRRKGKEPDRVKITDVEESIARPYGPEREEFVWEYEPELPRGCEGRWRHRYLPTWRLYVGDELYPARLDRRMFDVEHEYDWDRFFARNLEHLWSRYSNRLLSEVQTIQGEGLANILRGILTRKSLDTKPKQLSPKTAYQRVASFLSRQEARSALGSSDEFKKKFSSSPIFRKVVSDINTIEQRIEKTMASRQKLEQLIRDMFTGNKTVVLKDTDIKVETDEKENIGVASLSSGEKHTLCIFIEALLAECNTLLLDEPEISLHIDWQNNLISAMHELNPDTQIILATHSPEIMAGVEDQSIFRL